jgi:hypothetical protein
MYQVSALAALDKRFDHADDRPIDGKTLIAKMVAVDNIGRPKDNYLATLDAVLE